MLIARRRRSHKCRVEFPSADRGVAQSGQSIGLQNRGPRVRILPPLPHADNPGPLAQLAERRADNAEVGGSSPPRPTKVLISIRPLFPPNVIAQPSTPAASGEAGSVRKDCVWTSGTAPR